jgi:chromosome segregation ATPase
MNTKMIETNQKLHLTLICAVLAMTSAPQVGLAQTSAKEGITRLEENIENSKENIKQYKSNLDTVEANIKEVKKAQENVLEQSKKLQDQINTHNALMKKMQVQERELSQMMVSEKEKNAKDELRISEIEKLLVQIKSNIENREKNRKDYERQLTEVTDYKKEWQIFAETLKAQQLDMNKNLSDIKSQNDLWAGKKKGYEGEIKRWTAEVDKQEKTLNQVHSIANAKKDSGNDKK